MLYVTKDDALSECIDSNFPIWGLCLSTTCAHNGCITLGLNAGLSAALDCFDAFVHS
jgi:hypothetical protein